MYTIYAAFVSFTIGKLKKINTTAIAELNNHPTFGITLKAILVKVNAKTILN